MNLQELEEARKRLDQLPPSPENWHARLPLLKRLDDLFSCPELENDPALNRFYHEVCRRVAPASGCGSCTARRCWSRRRPAG